MPWYDRHGVLGTNLASKRIIGRITPCNVIQRTPHDTPTFVVWSCTVSGGGRLEFISYIWNGSEELCCRSGGHFRTPFSHRENWSPLEFIVTDINSRRPQPPCAVKDKTTNFLQPPSELTGVTFWYSKDHFQQKQKHHFNNSLSGAVFTLGWLVWHHFFLTDVFTSPPHSSLYPFTSFLAAVTKVKYVVWRRI